MKYDYSGIIKDMLDWYDLNARMLPWRDNPTPYYVWVSEIMLQQTRVEAVKPYFDRFVSELPDIKSLAYVEEERLLKLWEGLGYYNRARNLQKAALNIMDEYGGELPTSYEELIKLKGIGSYTAGAVASIAYQIPVPAVDGNVLRVAKRVAGSFDDITNGKVKKELEKDLLEIMPVDRPGDFNQSLMELGAVICIPNGKPLCEKCPIMHLCRGFHQDIVMRIPIKKEKKKRKLEEKTILLLEYQGKFAIKQRPKAGLLAGLWELPSLEGKLTVSGVEAFMNQKKDIELLGEAKHIFSHIEWRMIGYKIKLDQIPQDSGYVWVDKKELYEKYTLPSAFKAFKGCIGTIQDIFDSL